MNTRLATKLETAIGSNDAPQNLSKKEVIEAVAAFIASHNLKNLGGIDRIEDLPHKDVADLPITGTVFAVIANKLRMLGIETDDTVGGVMESLTYYKRDSESAAYYAHEIGCHCHGSFISPDIAAQRVLNLIGTAV